MSIHFACPSCGRTLEAAPGLYGKAAACAGCGRRLTVPALGIPAAPKPHGNSLSPPIPPAGRSPRWVWGALLGAGVLLVGVVTAASWYALTRPSAGVRETGRVAQAVAREERAEGPADLPESPAEPREETAPIRPAATPPPAENKEPSAPPARTTPAPTEKPVSPAPPAPKAIMPFAPVWRLKEGDTFYQELTVGQKSNLRVQGLPASSLLQYRVWSRFTVGKAGPDGSLAVGQKVERAKLLQADALTQSVLGGAVGRLPGTEFQLKLNRDMEVIEFRGVVGQPQVGGVQLPAGAGMQMVSLLDRDGWKELAQATFFNRDKPLTPNARWSKPMTHQWGPLGTWAGQIHYAYAGPQGTAHKITYAMQLTHKAPAQGGLVMGLPVGGANFQAVEAGGNLYFDLARGRVLAAEERFRVRGVLSIQLLGQNTPIEIDEEQQFQIRIADSLDP